MTGHAPPDVSAKYGLAFISQLAFEMNKISFPMVSWDDIRKAWANLDWTDVVGRTLPTSDESSGR